MFRRLLPLGIIALGWPSFFVSAEEPSERLRVQVTFGHRAATRSTIEPRLSSAVPGVQIAEISGVALEAEDSLGEKPTLHVGDGDVDGIVAVIAWKKTAEPMRKPHQIWAWLLDNGVPGQIARLKDDLGLTPDAPVFTVETKADGTRGFSIALEQLARHKAMWLPEHDCFITLADAPVDFSTHLASLRGERVLDRVKRQPEATLADFTARWEDMGNPKAWKQPWETSWLGTRGHIITTVGAHGSLYKFAIDRWARVRPDFASPHKFRFDPFWSDSEWAGQRLTDGLPVLVTNFTRAGQRCELEQFAAPCSRTATAARGEQPMVMFTKATLSGAPGPVKIAFRLASESKERHVELKQVDGQWLVVDRETGRIWLAITQGAGLDVQPGKEIGDDKDPRCEFELVGSLAAGEMREVVLKLVSPAASPDDGAALAALDFAAERAATLRYWEEWLSHGARFVVPETKVNELFRANLWHALRLPRFRVGERGEARTDLPYSNTAYGQLNADWPINHAVYVDYMLYGLRGQNAIAEEEFAAIFQTQQQRDGRIGGFANWGVYSPAMLYAIGQDFLLSRDRASFERLLPKSLKAMDWCLAQIAAAQSAKEAPGLICAPLNDLTHDARPWAFPNAYFVAGLAIFGRALEEFGHPRAGECIAVATRMKADVEHEFSRASVRAPVVQLADGTWNNYVPCDALTPRRLLDQWYPTDVDCGPLHMARLAAIDPRGWLATAMLHDSEDNLFLRQWGAANEPVYNMQGTAYLRRDEPEAAIRTFYSTMACAFSHGQIEPVEHRWAWGQYFGPPSTDGAWFELYRNLLLNELTDDVLFIGQATPRAWLADGQSITVERAPTYYGPVNVRIDSAAAKGSIRAQIEFTSERRPPRLIVRLRHPDKKPLRSVIVNGEAWKDFDATRECVQIVAPKTALYEITASY